MAKSAQVLTKAITASHFDTLSRPTSRFAPFSMPQYPAPDSSATSVGARGPRRSRPIGHIATAHAGFKEKSSEFSSNQRTPMEAFRSADPGTNNLYDCMRWIIERNLPMCDVDNSLTRRFVTKKPTATETLKDAMRRVPKRVGDRVEKEIGTSFGVVFDSWSSGLFLYLAVVAVASERERQARRAAYRSLVDGGWSDSGRTHRPPKKNASRVRQGRVDAARRSIRGCASHRLNIAVARLLSGYHEIIASILRIMTLFRQSKNAAKLARSTCAPSPLTLRGGRPHSQ
ncbi:hypothetical protein PybrP1_004172 [[Pythium] brassicae (nom. inval.)]|nr:hypothetical protein PybrP1_004172 [[Pythium] brassicae (nom. inval.)]